MERRLLTFFLSALLLSASAALLYLNGCSSSSHPPAGKIQHVVILFQENRTPDNLFHDPVLMANGADIASSGLNSSGDTIPLSPEPLGINYDLGHGHSSFLAMYDGGKMDGANNVGCSPTADCPANPQYMYVQASDVAPYLQLAEQYTFGDRMFQTNEGPSFPAHQFILSGTSAPSATSNLFAAENPKLGAGCAAPAGALVALIDPNGNQSSSMYPCFEHATLSDELEAAGLTWRYYAPSAGSIWTAPNAIQHICGPNAQPPNATACVGSQWTSNVVLYAGGNPDPILTDISDNQLAAVSWVIPDGRNSDHPGNPDDAGPSWVATIVNAIGSSAYWSNTAIIITWDDWGGWYDHVPPPQVIDDGTSWGSGYVYGFRVPLIVVSPYAKPAYISHVTHDFGSILRFIETTFGLPSLGYADAYADDLSDCFNYNQSPLQFQTIAAPLGAEYFRNDRRPPTDPDDE